MKENGISTVILSGVQRGRRIPWSHLHGFATPFENPLAPAPVELRYGSTGLGDDR